MWTEVWVAVSLVFFIFGHRGGWLGMAGDGMVAEQREVR